MNTPATLIPLQHVMFDLETLGTSSRAPIVQLAAVVFDVQGNIGAEFNVRIELGSKLALFEPDAEAIEWWIKQTRTAQEAVFTGERYSITQALMQFQGWVALTVAPAAKRTVFWSHATFDQPILVNAYNVCGYPLPIAHRDFMDIRTLNLLYRDDKPKATCEGLGVAHDALADCKYQATYVAEMLRAF